MVQQAVRVHMAVQRRDFCAVTREALCYAAHTCMFALPQSD